MKKLKRVVIKEELVTLTGDFRLGVVLGQMIYWSEKVSDLDKYILEEKERCMKFATSDQDIPNIELANGWVYKKAEELSEETMMGVQPKAMREYLKKLVDKGWLDERRNPKIKMDRILQYRVNLLKIQKDLMELGFSLDGYAINLNDFVDSEEKNESVTEGDLDNSNCLKENSKREKENRKGEKEARKGEKERAIPEITTEITNNKIYRVFDHYQKTFEGIYEIRMLSESRRAKIKARLKTYTPEELIKAIDNIRNSPWHMGGNPSSKFYATPEFIFRSDEMIEGWIQNKPQKQIERQSDSSNQQGERDSNRYKKL
ncbi:hypothetical protein EAL2_c10900 [Peptoclostridium acidaminophilum DSM 3953]|uniref:Uncharacterized protein n=1 Tax=Peptoclostridium acidaminophilum DSM 3953 TaxID=1286171 RepID=W8TEX9_PEPAC|nr:hypothetical protein [Peptoclostridium acidaminophilum]AHM56388.1 hypothetical protein EAL2_c10900 [Peptoclostridium acidaminophilum DSM 3953]